MRRAVRAVIIHDNKLLIMHRNKFGREYETLPGGNIEPGESLEQALTREITEETMVAMRIIRPVFVEEAGDPFGTQIIFLCEYQGGEPAVHPDSEEAAINKLGQNLYEARWLPVNQIESSTFVSERLKYAILDALRYGQFPAEAVRI